MGARLRVGGGSGEQRSRRGCRVRQKPGAAHRLGEGDERSSEVGETELSVGIFMGLRWAGNAEVYGLG